MAELFNRDMVITVGTVKIPIQFQDPKSETSRPSLRVSFTVVKEDNPSPNEAKIKILNLNPGHRAAVQSGEGTWPVVIDAGYVGNIQRIFSGELQNADPRKEATDWTTEIQAKDGQRQYASARMSQSYGAGTLISTVLKDAAVSLGLGAGNSMFKFDSPLRPIKDFKKGVVVTGRTTDILDKYVTSAGFRWSIQDGQLLILGLEETTSESVILLNASSGLVGTPEVGEKGIVKVKTLLRGSLQPGGKVKIEAREVRGVYKIEKLTHSGDTRGPDWYSEIEAKPLKGE